MRSILDILYEYSTKGKIIDIDCITEIIKIRKKEVILDTYIKAIEIIDDNYILKKYGLTNNIIATYDALNRTIEINTNKLNEDNFKNTNSNNLTKIQLYFNINCNILHIIFHEIEHAYQLKLSQEEKTCDLETKLSAIDFYVVNKCEKLINLSKTNPNYDFSSDTEMLNQLIIKRNNFHIKYHSLSPTERLAFIKPIEYILELIKPITNEISIIETIFKNKLYTYYLKGYDFKNEIISPTKRYIENFKCLGIHDEDTYFNDELYQLINENSRTDLVNRMTFGLDITENEYNLILSKKKKL